MKDWASILDGITEHFVGHFGSLSVEQLNWKPNSQTWSIAQNINHLIVVNESFYPILTLLKAGTYKPPFIAKFGFLVSFLSKKLLDAVQPDRKKKVKTFPIWQPKVSHIKAGVLQAFEKHQNELKQHIETSKAFVEKGAIIASPANRNIVYKLETAFDIIVFHEQRHLEQAKEVFQLQINNTSP